MLPASVQAEGEELDHRVEDTLRRADRIMYENKRVGKHIRNEKTAE